MKILAVFLMLGASAMAQQAGMISFDEERAKGNLHNPLPGSLTMCGPNGCKVVGQFDENNVIHWNDSVTLDDLKAAIQSQSDYTMWQVNQYRKAHPDR
jgi:hypothetical protein